MNGGKTSLEPHSSVSLTGARFNLFFFESKVKHWSKHLEDASDKRRKSALAFLRKQKAEGGTALFDGLREAFEDEEVDTIVLLSDGEPTVGDLIDPIAIVEEIKRMNELRGIIIHTISINWRGDLLRQLSEATGGLHRREQ